MMRNLSRYLIPLTLCLLMEFSGIAQIPEEMNHKPPKWIHETSHGLYNVTTFSVDPFYGPLFNGMQTIFGYKLNPFIAIGCGVGLERYVNMNMYEDFNANLSQIPVFAEIRYTILDRKIAPVVALQGGYKFLVNRSSTQVTTWREDIFPGFAYRTYSEYDYYHEGGFMFAVEAGARMKIYERIGLYLSAAYSLWTTSGEFYHWTYEYLSAPGGSVKESTTYYTLPSMSYNQVLLLRLGFTF